MNKSVTGGLFLTAKGEVFSQNSKRSCYFSRFSRVGDKFALFELNK